MNFQLTKEQEFVRKMVREFAETEVEPLAAEIDQEHRFPTETVEKMAKYGLLGIPFPTEYEGAGGDHISYAITVEELARVCASTGSYLFSSYITVLLAYLCMGYRRSEEEISYLTCYQAENSELSVLLSLTQVQTQADSRQEQSS